MLEIPTMVSASWIPFLMTGVDKRQMSPQRLAEALIIAAISAGAAGFVTVRQMEVKMEHINYSLARMEGAINGAIIAIEKQRDLRDQQMDQVKADINKLKVDLEKRR